MKPNTFEIVFDGDNSIFFPGQTVKGRVRCFNAQTLKMRSIKLKIIGSGHVAWTERENNNDYSYSNDEDYCEQKFHLYGQGEESHLEPGEHNFEFAFLLPPNLPSSFEGEFGYVRYHVKATVDLPWAIDIETKRVFSVNGNVDLNCLEGSANKVEVETSKNLCCFCCQSGPINVHCWLPHRGYVPGQVISFSAELENHSNSEIVGSFLQLVQTITYRSTTKNKVVDNVIFEAKREGFEREDHWSDFKISIPPLPPSPFLCCKIITIEYRVQLKVDPGSCSFSLIAPLPIMIGTIPLRQDFSMFQNNFIDPSAPLLDIIPYPSYQDLPQTSFGEYSYGATVSHLSETNTNDPQDNSVIGFKPSYVQYQSVERN